MLTLGRPQTESHVSLGLPLEAAAPMHLYVHLLDDAAKMVGL